MRKSHPNIFDCIFHHFSLILMHRRHVDDQHGDNNGRAIENYSPIFFCRLSPDVQNLPLKQKISPYGKVFAKNFPNYKIQLKTS